MSRGTVLILDDDASIRKVLTQALQRANYEVLIAASISAFHSRIQQDKIDCVVSDVILPDGSAFDFMPEMQRDYPNVPVVLISAQNTFMTALKAQEAKAFDYLPKPFDLENLIQTVERAIAQPKDTIKTSAAEAYHNSMPIVGRSSPMQAVYQSVARMSQSELPVMISGEIGTGKRLTAQVLHEFGLRKSGPFVWVDLSSLIAEEIEEKLFGSTEASTEENTGAVKRANRGTLYLHEVNKLPLRAQTRLLGLLNFSDRQDNQTNPSGQSDIRIISSTSQDIEHNINTGLFREDLFYRLGVAPLRLPSLKNRKEDIPDLARHFIRLCETQGSLVRHIEANAIRVLKSQTWPGNVLELENLIRRICQMYPQETITQDIVEAELKSRPYFRGGLAETEPGSDESFEDFIENHIDEFMKNNDKLDVGGLYGVMLREFEYPLIQKVLALTNGNQIKAAALLGLNRNTLRKKINDLGITITRIVN